MDISAKINGEDLGEITGFTMGVDVPVGPRGQHAGMTRSVILTIKRRAQSKNDSTATPFKYATNDTGRRQDVEGEIVLRDIRDEEDLYKIKMNIAFISKYFFEEFTALLGQRVPIEVIEISCGDVEFQTGGNNVSFKIPNF